MTVEEEKYEWFRQFYAQSEEREQKLIVMVQKLMAENSALKRKIKEGDAKCRFQLS